MGSSVGERRIEDKGEGEELKFLTSAWKANGISGDKNVESYPKWVDWKKIEAGQRFARDNIFSLFFAHFIALIFLFAYAPIRSVLLRTRRSDTGIKSLRRYLSTLTHVKKWYEEDIISLNGGATQDILRIRSVHACVSRHMLRTGKVEQNGNKEASAKTPSADRSPQLCKLVQDELRGMDFDCDASSLKLEDGPYLISQLDMIVTQFAFFGLVTTFPRRFGIFVDERIEGEKKFEEGSSGLDGFIHLWGLIGHLLGIEDRFNLCLEENSGMRGVILEKLLVPELCKCDANTVTLWNSLTSGISVFIPCISLVAVLRFTIETLGSRYRAGKVEWQGVSTERKRRGEEGGKLADACSWKDRSYFELMVAVLCEWIRVTYFRNVLNSLLRLSIYRATNKYLPSLKNIT